MAIAAVGGKVACNWTFSRLASIYRAHYSDCPVRGRSCAARIGVGGSRSYRPDFDVLGLAIKTNVVNLMGRSY